MIHASTFKLNTVLSILTRNCHNLTEQLFNHSDTQFLHCKVEKMHANFAIDGVTTTNCYHIFDIQILQKNSAYFNCLTDDVNLFIHNFLV